MKKLKKVIALLGMAAILSSAFFSCKGNDAGESGGGNNGGSQPGKEDPVVTPVEVADYQIKIAYSDTPVISETATAKIYNGETLVDTVNAKSEKLFIINKTGTEINVDNQLLLVEGNNVVVVPHNDENGYSKLSTSTTYTVVLEGVTGTPVAETYTFTTRAAQKIADNVINVGSAETDNFYTIQGAFNYLRKANATGNWTINVAEGKYHENLYYNGNANVTLAGPAEYSWKTENAPEAYVYWRNSQTLNSQRTRQVFIWQGKGNLVVKNMNFENTTKRAEETSSNVQAETFYFDSDADLVVYNSKFMSYQDTLLIGTSNSTTGYGGRAWFYDCQIGGDVDFIWGYASVALFEECNIVCRADGIKNSAEIFASRTVPSKEVLGKGFVLLNSEIAIEDGCDAYYGRSSGGGDSQALVINSKVISGTINPKLWNSAGDILLQDGTGDYICSFMDYGNIDKDGNPIITTGRLPKTNDMSKRIAEREYNGRYAILNREIVLNTCVYQDRVSKDAWDISAYETEFNATEDVSAKNLYVEPTYTKNVVGGNTVQLKVNKSGATYSSDDTEVATVDANGLVTTVALKDKTVKITVTDPDSGREDYSFVNVVPTYVKAGSITINDTVTDLPKYQMATITASFDVEPNDTDIVWKSSDTSVLRFVDESKKTLVDTITTTNKEVKVVTINEGNVTITAESGVTPTETTSGTKDFTVNSTRYYNAIEGTIIQDASLFGILNFQSGKTGIWHDIYVHAIYGTTNGKICASGNRIQSRYGTIYIPVTESARIDMTVQCTAEEDESKWFTKDMTDAEGVQPVYSKDTTTEFASDAERQSYAYHYTWELDYAVDTAKLVPGSKVKEIFDAATIDSNRSLVGATPDVNGKYFAIVIPGADRYITSISIIPDPSIHHEAPKATITVADFAEAKKSLDLNGSEKVTVTTTATASDGSTPSISYASESDVIATVDAATGEVTAVGIGETTITATAELEGCTPQSKSYTVHVSNTGTPEATYKIALDKTKGAAGDYGIFSTVSASGGSAGYHNEHGWRMAGGDTMAVKVAGPSVVKFGKCQYGASLPTSTNAKPTALTNGDNAGSCDADTMDFVYTGEAGLIVFTFAGQAYIHSVSVEPYVAPTATLTVSDFAETKITLDLNGSAENTTQTLTATCSNEKTPSIAYSTSDEAVATVNAATGAVTAVALGKAVITAVVSCEGAESVVKTYNVSVVNTAAVVRTNTYDFTNGITGITATEDETLGITLSGSGYHGTSYGANNAGTASFSVKGPALITFYPTYKMEGTVTLYAKGETATALGTATVSTDGNDAKIGATGVQDPNLYAASIVYTGDAADLDLAITGSNVYFWKIVVSQF